MVWPTALRARRLPRWAVIAGMASRMGHLWVLACDAAVHDVRSVRRLADLDGLTLTGGGGTDLRVGMRAAAALRPAPDVTVVLTDGRSPWPHRRPRGRTVIGLVDVSDRPPGLPSWATVVDVTPAARPIRQAR